MIHRIMEFRFELFWFLRQSVSFAYDWFGSRPWSRFVFGLPAVMFSALLLAAILKVNSDSYRVVLSSKYFDHGVDSLQNGTVEEADRCFVRAASLVHDPNVLQYAAARQFFEYDEPERGLAILETLAPLAYCGYRPAHGFLAEYYRTLLPQTDMSHVKSLYHRIHADDNDETDRCELAEFLSVRGYHDRAIECLKVLSTESPAVRLTLAHVYTRVGRLADAVREARLAEQDLLTCVERPAADQDAFILLSRVMTFQRRPLDAVFLLAEQCRTNAEPKIVDELLRCYTLWLSQMPAHVQLFQMRQLATAFQIRLDDANCLASVELTLSDGQPVRLPKPVAELHHRLLSAEGRWIAPFLRGTELASRGQWDNAVQELRSASELLPQQPIVMNNLAFVLLQQHLSLTVPEQADSDSGKAVRQPEPMSLQEAWQLADQAVGASPEIAGFRETRGRIAAAMERWKEAVGDLEASLKAGYDTQGLQAALTIARHKLAQQQTADADARAGQPHK